MSFWTRVRLPPNPLEGLVSNPSPIFDLDVIGIKAMFGVIAIVAKFPEIPVDDSYRASYAEIADWIRLTHDGMKVTKTCIADVKRKAGLDVTYRGTVIQGKKPQKATIEKEAAVMEAFRHFGMI